MIALGPVPTVLDIGPGAFHQIAAGIDSGGNPRLLHEDNAGRAMLLLHFFLLIHADKAAIQILRLLVQAELIRLQIGGLILQLAHIIPEQLQLVLQLLLRFFQGLLPLGQLGFALGQLLLAGRQLGFHGAEIPLQLTGHRGCRKQLALKPVEGGNILFRRVVRRKGGDGELRTGKAGSQLRRLGRQAGNRHANAAGGGVNSFAHCGELPVNAGNGGSVAGSPCFIGCLLALIFLVGFLCGIIFRLFFQVFIIGSQFGLVVRLCFFASILRRFFRLFNGNRLIRHRGRIPTGVFRRIAQCLQGSDHGIYAASSRIQTVCGCRQLGNDSLYHRLGSIEGGRRLIQLLLRRFQLLFTSLQLRLGSGKLLLAVPDHAGPQLIAAHGSSVGGQIGTVLGGVIVMLLLQGFQLRQGLLITDAVFQLGGKFSIGVSLFLQALVLFQAVFQGRVRFPKAKGPVDQQKQAQYRKHNGKHSCKCRVLHFPFLPFNL